MAKLALLVSLIALVISVLAYQKAGGSVDLAEQLKMMRKETADSLSRMEKALRPSGAPASQP